MANQPGLPVEIDVFAHPAGAPEPYTIDWRFQGGPSRGNTPIDLPRNSGSHDMTFTLHDSSGKGLHFKGTPQEAMWVRPGQQCPTGKGNGANQVTFGSVSTDRLVLNVNDDNSGNRRNLHYMLRFDPEGNDFDPEIRNGGGTTIASTAAVAIGTAVIGAAAATLVSDEATTLTIATWAIVGGIIGLVAKMFMGRGFGSAAPEM